MVVEKLNQQLSQYLRKHFVRLRPPRPQRNAILPKDYKRHSDFNAIERELAFDIDLTDYDGVRRCCS
ncbi:hypothetical protein KIN20_036565 [Parelaphostrongylus tenuis]|uniref:Uncharacterized protein n=1 Tax=Parelaphostrongylus tenuis TaxID=148309 RepID=A0AAD5WLA7_PARTN|nr:hypothetical protein KIN20_036565 [Parelaphostrongylus tenuis]